MEDMVDFFAKHFFLTISLNNVISQDYGRNGTPSFTHNVMVIWGCFQLIVFKRQLVELGFKHWSLRLTN